MGILDDFQNNALNSMLGGSSSPLLNGVLHMIQNQPGGLAGLVQCFQEKGLGGLAASWVGTGQNLPITADQINHVLGSDQVKQMAARAGLSPEVAGNMLSQLLPSLVDKLTPNGQIPQHSTLLESCMSMLQSFQKTGTDG